MSVVCKLFTFQSSPLKLLGLLEPNFSGMMFWRSCINIPCSLWKKENKTKNQKQKKPHKTVMEKVVHILIGHYTKIIFFSETIVPIGTKSYRNIVWKSSIYNFHSAAINWQTKNTTIRTVPKSNIKIVERGKWIPQHTNTITWPLAWYRHFNTKWQD